MFAVSHTVTLTMMTSILLLNALPTPIVSTGPLSQQLRYTEELGRIMCHEDGSGWDEHWLNQCKSGVAILSTGTIWIGLAMLAAQWWAISEVWNWAVLQWRRGDNTEWSTKSDMIEYMDKKQG
jgi:hypothetical protein